MSAKQVWRLSADRLTLYSTGREPITVTPDVLIADRLTRMRGAGSVAAPRLIRDRVTRQRGVSTYTGTGGGGSGPNSRDNLVPLYGSYIPQPSQVGSKTRYEDCDEWNSPTTSDVTMTLPTNGSGLFRKIVYGRVRPGSVIEAEDCYFVGPPGAPTGTGDTAILDYDDAPLAGSHFLDCTIAPRYPHARLNGFKGGRHKIERCHIFWTVDGDGPYTKPGKTYATDVKIWASRIEKMINFGGRFYANHTPAYWDGTSFTAEGSGTIQRSAYPNDMLPSYDTGHKDGNHADCIEIHNGFGSHTFDGNGFPTGDGIHIWGNALICDDAYGQNFDPSGSGLIVPGQPGSRPGSSLGYGDNTKRGIPGGGQKPGMTRPVPPSSGLWPMSTGQYPSNGVSLYIGNVDRRIDQATTVVAHGNYINHGNMGAQFQDQGKGSVRSYFYDNRFGPDYFMYRYSENRDVYVVRTNTTEGSGLVVIAPHPVTGTPAFGPGGNNRWLDPQNIRGQNGQPLVTGSSSLAGVRWS